MSPGPSTGPGTQLVLWVNLPVTNKSLCRTRARTGRSLLTSHLKVAAEYGRLGGGVGVGDLEHNPRAQQNALKRGC